MRVPRQVQRLFEVTAQLGRGEINCTVQIIILHCRVIGEVTTRGLAWCLRMAATLLDGGRTSPLAPWMTSVARPALLAGGQSRHCGSPTGRYCRARQRQ